MLSLMIGNTVGCSSYNGAIVMTIIMDLIFHSLDNNLTFPSLVKVVCPNCALIYIYMKLLDTFCREQVQV